MSAVRETLGKNPHTATRLPGATYGSLYKSHSSVTVPPNLSWVHSQLVSTANPNKDEVAADSLAEAVGNNERAKAYSTAFWSGMSCSATRDGLPSGGVTIRR